HQQPQEGYSAPLPATWGRGKANGDGRFRLTARLPREPRYYSHRMYGVAVLAAARGHGLGWQFLSLREPAADVSGRLQPEQGLRGQLIALQGQPVAGARIEVVRIGKPPPHFGGFTSADEDERIEVQAGTYPVRGTIRFWEQEIRLREAPEPFL